MKPTQPNPGVNAGTGEQNRSTPDSMDQADRSNGDNGATGDRGDGIDPATELNDEINDDPAITGVQDGD